MKYGKYILAPVVYIAAFLLTTILLMYLLSIISPPWDWRQGNPMPDVLKWGIQVALLISSFSAGFIIGKFFRFPKISHSLLSALLIPMILLSLAAVMNHFELKSGSNGSFSYSPMRVSLDFLFFLAPPLAGAYLGFQLRNRKKRYSK